MCLCFQIGATITNTLAQTCAFVCKQFIVIMFIIIRVRGVEAGVGGTGRGDGGTGAEGEAVGKGDQAERGGAK